MSYLWVYLGRDLSFVLQSEVLVCYGWEKFVLLSSGVSDMTRGGIRDYFFMLDMFVFGDAWLGY